MPNSLTRSKALDRPAVWLALAALGLSLANPAHAHGDMASALPDEPGLRMGLSAAVSYIDASQLLPSARLAGYLMQGDPGLDRRGAALEHVVVDVGWRLNKTLGANLAVGQHDSDPAHIEAAWLQGRWQFSRDDWLLTVGRQKPELGAVMTPAGHLDRFALVPLAKHMAVDGDWIDDGVQLGWRREGPEQRWSMDAGLWNGQVFPGARSGAVVPALHAGWQGGDWAVDGFVARFDVRGRGAQINSSTGAHSHTAPVCDALLKQIVCFDGRSNLAGLSARWDSHQWPVSVSAAGWMRRDSGALYSANGSGQYSGNNTGGWVDAVWRFHPKAEWGVRTERLVAEHRLSGAGATLLATEAGFSAYQPARRTAWMLGYSPTNTVDLRLEAGRESVAGIDARFVVLRLVARLDFLFAGGKP